jgi:hypothetical protein
MNKLNIKEAIEFVNEYTHCSDDNKSKWYDVHDFLEKKHKVIAFIKEGEKYKKMSEECINYFNSVNDNYIKKLKQKYFPQPVKKTITIEESLLIDIVHQIDVCFKDYVRQHEAMDLPFNLNVLSNAIVESIERIFNNDEEDEEDIPDDEKNFYRKGGYER